MRWGWTEALASVAAARKVAFAGRHLAIVRKKARAEYAVGRIGPLRPRLSGRMIAAARSFRLAEDGVFARHRAYNIVGMDVAAVTSRVLTNSAATQVETVRNSSAVIILSLLSSRPGLAVMMR